MSTTSKTQRVRNYVGGLHLSWLTVGMYAVVLAFADGFVITALNGTVGAVERQTPPFQRWLQLSLVRTPFYVVAVVVALVLTRRWAGRASRWVKTAVAMALIVVTTVLFAAVELSVNAAYDYSLQAKHIEFTHNLHNPSSLAPGVVPGTTAKCNVVCVAKHQTLLVHFTAIGLATTIILLVNLVLAVWLLAVRGGRVWNPVRRTTVAATVEPVAQPALV